MKKRVFILIDCIFVVIFTLMLTMCGGDGAPPPPGPTDIHDVDAGTHTMDLPGGEILTIDTPVPLTCNTNPNPSTYPPGSNIKPISLAGTLGAGQTIKVTINSDNGFSSNDVIAYVDAGAWTPLTTTHSSGNKTISATILHNMMLGLAFKPLNDSGEVILGVKTLTYTLSGTVTENGTGLQGVTMALSGTASGTTITDANGGYSFSSLSAGAYTVTPSLSNYTFSPPSDTVTITTSDAAGVDFAATPAPATYSISGTVTESGTGLQGVTMTLTGAASRTTTTDASGDYSFSGLGNGNYTVTPGLANYYFDYDYRDVFINNSDVAGVDFEATAVPVTYSISGTVTESGTGLQGVTMTLTGAASRTTTTDASGDYEFSGLSNGGYTVIPSKSSYTFSPVSTAVTISDADYTDVDFTDAGSTYTISGQITYDTSSGTIGFREVTVTLSGASSGNTTTDASGYYAFSGLAGGGSYTVSASKTGYSFSGGWSGTLTGNVTDAGFTAIGPSYYISGYVNNWNLGGGVSGVEMTLDTTPALSVFTDSSGNYTTTSVPNGTYTLTPSLSGSRVAFYPSEKTLTVAGSSLFGEVFNTTIIYSVSGTVSYSGTKTGWVHINVIDQWGWMPGVGTSIKVTGSGSWPFTIRGVEAGTYTLDAYMDNLGYGSRNASNPSGSSSGFSVVDTDITGQFITLTDPGAITPVVPEIYTVFPANQSASIMWEGPTDINDLEIAQSYNVYWSTNSGVSKTAYDGMANAPSMEDTFYIATGLTDGSDYYFVVTAIADGTESAESTTFGPVTIGATTGDYTISGTITFSQTATGPMYVIVYNEEGANVYFTYIASPLSPQSYSISGVPADSWYFFVFIDMNDNGQFDIGENFPDWEDIEIVLTGNVTQDLTIGPLGNASVEVSTWHNEGGNYSLMLDVNEESKHVVKASLVSGTHLPGVIDLGYDYEDTEIGTWLSFYTTRPNVGDTYSFDITYADSTTETLHASVTTVLDSFATPISPVGSAPGATHPTFTWAAPASPPPLYEYGIGVWEYMGGQIWWTDEIPSSETSVEFNFDDEADQDPLTPFVTYSWQIKVIDSNGNVAESSSVDFTP